MDMEEIAKITLDRYYSDPDFIMAGLRCAAEVDDHEMFKGVFLECKKRGIDIAKIITEDIAKYENLHGKLSGEDLIVMKSSRVRSPMTYNTSPADPEKP